MLAYHITITVKKTFQFKIAKGNYLSKTAEIEVSSPGLSGVGL